MAGSQCSSRFQAVLDNYRPELSEYETLYKHFHQNPELSNLEHETASTIETHLRKLSPNGELDIRTNVGGGLIAICRNGSGPVALLRADMDALAVPEKSGLPYASTKVQKDVDGLTKRVMHACGHDFHMAGLLAVTETLLAARHVWSGTVISLFQPAEELGTGAQRMVDAGLYDVDKHACPIPDICLTQHVYPERAGTIQTKSGAFFSAADSYRITIYGKGGHGSMPHKCIDPVVIASHIVVRLQTIVSREVPPDETAVVTVGSVQSGHAVNVISDEAVIQVNVRSITDASRKIILDGIKRIVEAECMAGRCPKPAKFEKLGDFPLTDNDEEATRKIQQSFDEHFGAAHSLNRKAHLASEDFGIFGTAVNRPYVYWTFGGFDDETWEEHERNGTLDELPVNHSPYFAPAIQPTLKTGVDALVVAALTFVGKDQ